MSLLTGLVAYWSMDEASGTRADSTANGYDLSDNNTVASASGKINNAADFTPGNSEWLNVADNNDFDFSTTFSLQAWINIDNLAIDLGIVTKWDYQTQGSWGYQTDQGNNDEIMMFVADALDDAGDNRGRTTDANLSADTWYHTIWLYDGSLAAANRLKCYINNSQKTLNIEGTIPTSLQNSTADVRVGTWGGTLSGRYFDGLIDEVGLWNRVLTTDEISSLYNSGNGLAYSQFAGFKPRIFFF